MNIDSLINGLTKIGPIVKDTLKDEGVKQILFGTYSDGKARNFTDAMNGEFLSPKQKKKIKKKKKKKKETKFRL